MIDLILSIICSSLIFLLFRVFPRYNVFNFTAIVINYFIAGITGILLLNHLPSSREYFSYSWLPLALFLGIIFISLFNLMATTSQKLGASVASVANKMALIIPVIVAFIWYEDSLNLIKGIAITMALLGVFLGTWKERDSSEKFEVKWAILPILLFLGSGLIDTLINYTQKFHLTAKPMGESALFTSSLFIIACTIGCIILLVIPSLRKLNLATCIAGVTLGIINYGSIFFLIRALDNSGFQSSILFPINNIGVVMLTSISSLIIFQEKFSKKNKIGLVISILSIALIAVNS